MSDPKPSVLIAGAGPTGLILAIVLARRGVAVRIVDRKAGPARESRAIGVQARTLELYRMLGLAEAVVAGGLPIGTFEVRYEGERQAELPLRRMGEGVSPFPYLLAYPQDVHEPLLVRTLAGLGVAVEWETALNRFAPDAEGVTAVLEGPGGSEEVRAGWLVGADGGRSAVREGLDIGFEGGHAEGLFYVADVSGGGIGDRVVLGLGRDRLAAMFPLPGGRARLLGLVPEGADADGRVSFEDVVPDARRYLGAVPEDVAWFSTYHVRHRAAERFRQGRCFLAGDAGHVHSPVGGQGMNTGIGDALNLGWKLAAVARGEAAEAILGSYEPERMPFARLLVATTDRAFLGLTDDGWLGRAVRSRLMPGVLGLASRLGLLGPALFRTVSQTRIRYRSSPLAEGDWGRLKGGDRLPWLPDLDNHAPLDFSWQVHVHGEPSPALRAWAAARGWALRDWPWTDSARAAGLRRDGAVLVRPDGYVGCLAEGPEAVAALEGYAARWGLGGAGTAAARSVAG